MTKRKWFKTSAHYSKKEAFDVVKKLQQIAPLSSYPHPARYKVKKEVYKGKITGRWGVWQDYDTAKIKYGLSGFKI
jgi:hypothetical protein